MDLLIYSLKLVGLASLRRLDSYLHRWGLECEEYRAFLKIVFANAPSSGLRTSGVPLRPMGLLKDFHIF